MSTILRNHIEKIVQLTDEEFDWVAGHFKTRKLKKHQFLLQEGDTTHVLYDNFVVSGLLKVYHTNEDGHEHILQFAPEDWWVGDYRAFSARSPALVNISCLENCEVLSISYENREKVCELHKMERFFRKKSNAGYVGLQRRILSLLNNNAKERYEEFLNLYPGLSQRLSKTLIASYLGVSRETLSRLSA